MIEIRHLRDSPIETTPIYHIYIHVYTLVNTLLHGINFKPCFYLVTVELLAPNPYMIDGGLEAQYKHNVFVVWWCECSVSGLGLVLGDGVVEWGGGLGGGCLLCPGRSLVIPPMLPPATCPDPHYPPPLSPPPPTCPSPIIPTSPSHVCCQYSQWITQQRNSSISPSF